MISSQSVLSLSHKIQSGSSRITIIKRIDKIDKVVVMVLVVAELKKVVISCSSSEKFRNPSSNGS